jgi:phosphoglycerate dehydrogenase-like enzyme
MSKYMFNERREFEYDVENLPIKKVGVVGMGRVGERIKVKVHPFKNTLIYSAFLLNVKLTVESGVLFPSKRIWEGFSKSLTIRY